MKKLLIIITFISIFLLASCDDEEPNNTEFRSQSTTERSTEDIIDDIVDGVKSPFN